MSKLFISIKIVIFSFLFKFYGIIRRIAPRDLARPILIIRNELFHYKEHLRSLLKVNSFIKKSDPIRLELGAGERRLDGWISIDYNPSADLHLDLSRPLPFTDDSVERIYSSHLLEHFSYPQPLIGLLGECFRTLKPGGAFEVAVPDGGSKIRAYVNKQKILTGLNTKNIDPQYQKSPMDQVAWYIFMYGEHHYLFDEENLMLVIESAGFTNVRIREFNPLIDLESRREESIYVTATKPQEI
jgi:predicted SAM-dependent methyltransferase